MNNHATSQGDSHSQVIERYKNQLTETNSSIGRLMKKWASIGIVRGLLILVSITLLVLGFISYAGIPTTWLAASGLVFLVFLVVAYFHVGIEEELFRLRLEAKFSRYSIAQLNRSWDELPQVKVPQSLLSLPVANDLDFFGRSSLMQLVCSAETPIGQRQLAEWMIELPSAQEIMLRQEAAQELEGWEQHRNRLRLLGKLITTQHSDPAKFLAWAIRGRDNVAGPFTIWFARAISVYQIIVLLLFVFQLFSLTTFAIFFCSGLAIAFAATVVISGKIHSVFNEVAARQQDAEHYLSLFKLIGNAKPKSEYLKQQQASLKAGSITALAAFSILERRTWLANMRRNGMFYFVYLTLQFVFLWDVHALVWLRNWRERFGKYVSTWFDAIGKWEAISSLAKLANDHPQWTYPTVTAQPKSQAAFQADQIGHPLLPEAGRICNDVVVGPTGSILLVTGSNMSGKSTLLRSVGLNVALAQMGTVTCAQQLSMPCVELQTSIRISDSLADGVSYYFAELRRLKEVVEAAKHRKPDAERVLLYLLDEILQGTNSRERQIAVTKVLEHLVESQAIGAISTHDLELATSENLKTAFRPVHFRETISTAGGKREMTFDYKMREGIATTTNALELLRIVGLTEDE